MASKKIENAIIIFGTGRSGTTLLYNILALHHSFAWISGYVNKFPNYPSLSYLNRIQEFSELERWNRYVKKWPRPAEAYGFWEYYFKNFTNYPDGIITTNSNIQKCRQSINKICSINRKYKFITKLTGHSRISVLESVFKDPIILWIDRNPESIIYSFYNRKWFYKDFKDLFEEGKQEELIKQYCHKYKEFIAHKIKLSDRFNLISVEYESLASSPGEFFKELFPRLGLSPCKKFDIMINSWTINPKMNEKWKVNLSEKSKDLIKSSCF